MDDILRRGIFGIADIVNDRNDLCAGSLGNSIDTGSEVQQQTLRCLVPDTLRENQKISTHLQNTDGIFSGSLSAGGNLPVAQHHTVQPCADAVQGVEKRWKEAKQNVRMTWDGADSAHNIILKVMVDAEDYRFVR